jgi:hypothetical protein
MRINLTFESAYFARTREQQLYASACVAASWRASSSASDDMPALHPRFHPTLWVVWVHSLREPLVCQPFSSRAFNEAFEPRQCVVLDVPFIQSERKFVNISAKMLFASVMVDADQAALEDGEDAFNFVRGDGASYILASAVIDRFVLERARLDAA